MGKHLKFCKLEMYFNLQMSLSLFLSWLFYPLQAVSLQFLGARIQTWTISFVLWLHYGFETFWWEGLRTWSWLMGKHVQSSKRCIQLGKRTPLSAISSIPWGYMPMKSNMVVVDICLIHTCSKHIESAKWLVSELTLRLSEQSEVFF